MFEMEFKRVILQGGWHYGSKWNWEWLFLSGENTKNSDKSSFLKKMSDHTNEILEKKLAKKKKKRAGRIYKTDLRGFNFD